MSDERYIVMRNWDRFQHPDVTRSMNVPWVKNYTALMTDDNYLDLTEHQALVLHRLWLTYASARCQLRLNTASLSRRLHVRVTMRDLEALNHAGFVEFLQAERLQDASLARAPTYVREEERREDKDKERTYERTNENEKNAEEQKVEADENHADLDSHTEDRSRELDELEKQLAESFDFGDASW